MAMENIGIHLTDEDNQTIKLNDNCELIFGSGADGNDYSAGDMTFAWDGTDFDVTQLTANSAINLGVDGAGIDMKWFGDTASNYLLWDQSANQLLYSGTAGTFQWGTRASSVGSGTALSDTRTNLMGLFADDGGTAGTSGYHWSVVNPRLLLTATAANREQEASVVRAQLVQKQGTARHHQAALTGSYEVNTALTVGGQIWSTGPWYQCAVRGRIGAGTGITTIDTYGILAAFVAESSTISFAANNGYYCAYYAGKPSASNIDWEYGLYVTDAAHGIYLDVDAGAVSGEEHAMDIVSVGTMTSGDSLVGLNVTTAPTGTAASWVSGLYVKTTQASKVVNGYLCAVEFELASTAANPSDHALMVLNWSCNHTGSPAAADPYIMLRDYGTTHANCFVRFFNDTGMSAEKSATTLVTTNLTDGYEAHVNGAIRCMIGSTPYWIPISSTAPS